MEDVGKTIPSPVCGIKQKPEDREVFIFLGELLFAELNHTIYFRVTINVSIPKVAAYFSHGYYLSNEETPGDSIQLKLLADKLR